MIIDSNTNFLFLADSLKKVRHKEFLADCRQELDSNNIKYDFLPGTNDIWAVDYMPIQTSTNTFVQFKYFPDYLRKTKKWLKTITDSSKVCENLGIDIVKSDLVIDGGNIICSNDTAILTEKIFPENPTLSQEEVLKKLREQLGIDKIVIIPWDKNDIIGHADGMVRFLNDTTVLINSYEEEDRELEIKLKATLKAAKLEFLEIPYPVYKNRSLLDATGIYLNYLQMEGVVFLPVFGIAEDETALKKFETLFGSSRIVPVRCNSIAGLGGVLNCVSWNILA